MVDRRSVIRAVFVGVLSGSLNYLFDPHQSPGDFIQALYPARDFLMNQPPLARHILGYVPSPLTITPLGLPFSFMSPQLAGALWFGVVAALLVWVQRQRPVWPWVFSACFFEDTIYRQYAPLLWVLAQTDLSLVGLLIKPHTALPLIIRRPGRYWLSGLIVVIVGLWSLAVFGWDWPLVWLRQLGTYTGRSPMTTLLGLGAFGLAVWSRQWLIVAYCVVPVRGLYDLLPVFGEFRRVRSQWLGFGASWLAALWVDSNDRILVFLSASLIILLFDKTSPDALSGP
ncbi:MAG: hypothetical protein IPO08_23660 [Xanthomonadales bacterium]|nr:hypothetical protein [Xanthomonadales bacterium]